MPFLHSKFVLQCFTNGTFLKKIRYEEDSDSVDAKYNGWDTHCHFHLTTGDLRLMTSFVFFVGNHWSLVY